MKVNCRLLDAIVRVLGGVAAVHAVASESEIGSSRSSMRELFHGRRRKAGIITLVMSLVLMAGWIRSRTVADRIAIRKYGAATEYLVSQESGLGWAKEIYFSPISVNVLTDVQYQEWCGFKYGQKLMSPAIPVCKVSVRIFPYWLLTTPLTLLSAYLLLWNPRNPESRPPQN